MHTVRQRSIVTDARGAPFNAVTKTLVRGTGWYDRDYYSLAIVPDGGGNVATHPSQGQLRSSEFSPGELVLFRPADATYLQPFRSHDFTITFVSFPSTSWRNFARLTGLNSGWERAVEPPKATIHSDESTIMTSFTRAMRRFQDGPTIFDLVEFLAAVVPFLGSGVGVGAGQEPSQAPDWLVNSLEAMREEPNLRAGVPRLTELAHVSSGYLALMTRRHYGRTPIALVTDIRLQYAAYLLWTSSASIGSIAERCGFRSLAYFSNRFHQEFQVSPRSYRSRPTRFPAAEWAS